MTTIDAEKAKAQAIKRINDAIIVLEAAKFRATHLPADDWRHIGDIQKLATDIEEVAASWSGVAL